MSIIICLLYKVLFFACTCPLRSTILFSRLEKNTSGLKLTNIPSWEGLNLPIFPSNKQKIKMFSDPICSYCELPYKLSNCHNDIANWGFVNFAIYFNCHHHYVSNLTSVISDSDWKSTPSIALLYLWIKLEGVASYPIGWLGFRLMP